MKELWTTGDVAEQTGVSYRTVDRWCEDHGLPHIRRGKWRLIDPVEFEAWFAEHADAALAIARRMNRAKPSHQLSDGTRKKLATVMDEGRGAVLRMTQRDKTEQGLIASHIARLKAERAKKAQRTQESHQCQSNRQSS